MNETGEQILCALSTARKPLRCAEIAQACGRETGWGTSREIANLKRQGLIESTSHGFYAKGLGCRKSGSCAVPARPAR